MENSENKKELLPTDQSRQIQLTVNRPDTDENALDLGNVLLCMNRRRRLFAWVLVLCLAVGICAPLLLYQFNKPELSVSSVVTLRYEAPVKVLEKGKNGEEDKWVIPDDPEYELVSDLSAPDGTDLDVNQVTSSYVLQTALEGLNLSKPITVSALRGNIGIRTLLTEESSRTKESLQGLADAKNADAYKQLEKAEMKYQNRFVVSLTNGFGEEGSTIKTELKDEELKLLLDRVLTVYNQYLVQTYADVKLPEDSFSVIDIQELDVPDSLDQLRAGIDTLYAYCNEKTETVKAYRSWKTGRNLEDWMEILQTFKSINIDYLYALVSEDAVTRDKTALMTSWKHQLRTAQNSLDEVNENIVETKKILASYKNDEVYVSLQESDAAKTTRAATEYYNKLVLKQTENYEKAAKLKSTISDYTNRISRLEAAKETAISEAIETELARSLSSAQGLYEDIRAHMEELFASPMYTTFEDHSAAQGKLPSFLASSAKKMIIGGVAGAVIACGLWFLAGLMQEISKNAKLKEARSLRFGRDDNGDKERRSFDCARDDNNGKEAAVK